jgi:hypothetical protein
VVHWCCGQSLLRLGNGSCSTQHQHWMGRLKSKKANSPTRFIVVFLRRNKREVVDSIRHILRVAHKRMSGDDENSLDQRFSGIAVYRNRLQEHSAIRRLLVRNLRSSLQQWERKAKNQPVDGAEDMRPMNVHSMLALERARTRIQPHESKFVPHFDCEFAVCDCYTHEFVVSCTSVARTQRYDGWQNRCLNCGQTWKPDPESGGGFSFRTQHLRRKNHGK